MSTHILSTLFESSPCVYQIAKISRFQEAGILNNGSLPSTLFDSTKSTQAGSKELTTAG